MLHLDFTDKTALVTGSSSGMGAKIANDLLALGAKVALLDKAPSLISHPNSQTFQGDLTDPKFVQDSIDTVANGSRLHYLVNAAGVLWLHHDKSATTIDLKIWDEVMLINLKTMVHTCRAAIPHIKEAGGGAIVNISTTQCYRGDHKPQDAYQAAKAGVIALSKSLAVQFASDCIRVNTLVPGPTETPMQKRWKTDSDLIGRTAANIPLGRVAQPSDMSHAVLFLLSDLAGYITGTELIVDGGYLAQP